MSKRDAQLVIYNGEKLPDARDAAVIAARKLGCTCSPEVIIEGIRARVRHDDACALLRSLEAPE